MPGGRITRSTPGLAPQAARSTRASAIAGVLGLRTTSRLRQAKSLGRVSRRGSVAETPPRRARPRLLCARACAHPAPRSPPRARAVLIRSSHNSTGSPLRRVTASASSRAARALSFSSPSPVSGKPPRPQPAGGRRRARGVSRMGKRFPARRVSVSSGEARICDSSDSARPIRISPQSMARRRPAVGKHASFPSSPSSPSSTAPSWRRTPCCSWCASSARAGTRAPRPAACRRGSCAAGTPG